MAAALLFELTSGFQEAERFAEEDDPLTLHIQVYNVETIGSEKGIHNL
jgi:hypothetical protein